MKSRWLAPLLVITLAAAAGATAWVIGTDAWKALAPRGIEIHARMAEKGGWSPENLSAVAGQPLHLRLTSDDVMHGFAIGQSDRPAVDVIPGEFTEVTLTFDKPGKYTYYCTRWCGPNHWRMRGVIEVSGSQPQAAPLDPRPLYVALGLNLDKPHPAAVLPSVKPSSPGGAQFRAAIPSSYQSQAYYRSHSPEQTWQALRLDPVLRAYSDQEVWDMAAGVARLNISDRDIQEGKALYSANCAACHGDSGKGDGVMARSLDQGSMSSMGASSSGTPESKTSGPADLADPAAMLGASPALLQGKIIRGGMGTGMPYWGPIFTDPQTWAIVAYLESFQFDLEGKP